MATDLSELQTAQSVKLAGADANGNETSFAQVLSSAPTSNEIGLVTRNIPSGTQQVSGTVNVGQFSPYQTTLYNRLRVSTLFPIVYSNFSMHDEPYLIDNITTGTASRSGPTASESIINMTVGTSASDSNQRMTRRYYRYQPGRAHMVTQAILPGSTHANCRKRWGIFNASNGIFWELQGTTMKVVVRSSTSGSPVDTAITQANWNLDKLDGTGTSGITLDVTKMNVFVIEYTWHGVGAVRFGVQSNGTIIYVHQINFTNVIASVYTSNMFMPVRWTIDNTGTTSGTGTLRQGSFNYSVEQSEAAETGWLFGIDTGVTTRTVLAGGYLPVLSIRPKATFNGFTNRAAVIPLSMEVLPQNPVNYRIYVGNTLSGASWNDVHANSCVEYDVSANSLSGGRLIFGGYTSTSDGKTKTSINSGTSFEENLLLVLSEAAATGDILTIAVRGMSLTSNTSAAVTWKEVY